MIDPFNKLNVDISCLGNHELDNGFEHAEKLVKKTNCPWILSNLEDKSKGNKPLAGVLPHLCLEHQGFKIGFGGFADESWTDTFIPEIDCSLVEYTDYNVRLNEVSKKLKSEERCDLFFSLNHVRSQDDRLMASSNSSNEVDMILGGHDHSYLVELN